MQKAESLRGRADRFAGRREEGAGMRPARVLALFAVLLAGPAGCVTDPLGRHTAFNDTQRQYTQALRWGEIEKASSFVDPALREQFLAHAPAFQALRITDFAIGEVDYRDDSATVTVTYDGYSLDSFVERKIREEQAWYREDGSNRWRVRSDVAVFAEAAGAASR
jgi:hypothetical protein